MISRNFSSFFHFLGPELPAACAFASPSMITTLDNTGVILIGCLDFMSNSYDKVYKLENIDGKLAWQIMDVELKQPRSSRPVTMLIPDEMVTCNN